MSDKQQSLVVHLRQLEERLLQPEIRRNPEAVAALLADGFREFGSSGRIFSKQQILDDLTTEAGHNLTLTDFHCEMPSPDVALVTYRSARKTESHATMEALRSSLWVYRDHRWQMLFHQGTKL